HIHHRERLAASNRPVPARSAAFPFETALRSSHHVHREIGKREPRKERSMKIGDVSRARRFADPVRLRWYAYHRALRFALRMRQREAPPVCDPAAVAKATPPRGDSE